MGNSGYEDLSAEEKQEIDAIAQSCIESIFGDEQKQSEEAEAIQGAMRGGEGDMDELKPIEETKEPKKRGPKPKNKVECICKRIPDAIRRQLEDDLAIISEEIAELEERKEAISNYLSGR